MRSWSVRSSTGTRAILTASSADAGTRRRWCSSRAAGIRRLASDARSLPASLSGGGACDGRLEFSSLDIESLGPESVLARGRWRLTMPDGTKPGGLFTVIFRKLPEGWKIVHDHTSAEEVKPAASQ